MLGSLQRLNTFFIMSLALVIFGFSASANAQLNPADGQKLQQVFQDYLEKTKNEVAIDGSQLLTKGSVTVENKGSYFAVKLPDLALVSATGGRAEIGVIAVNALPASDPGMWKMTMALPTPIVYFDENSEPLFSVDIGQQNFAGIFHEEHKLFLKLKATYQDIEFAGLQDDRYVVKMPELSALYNLEQNANGNWSGPNDFEIKDMEILKDGVSYAKASKIRFDSQFDDYSLDAMNEYVEKLNAVNQNLASGTAQMSPEHVIAMYNLVTELLGQAFDGFDIEISTEDFVVTPPKKPGESVRIGKAAFGLGMDGFRENKLRIQYRVNYDDLDISTLEADVEGLVPSRFNFNISLNDIPYREVVALGQQSIQGVMQQPGAAQIIGMQALMTLPQLLTQAASNLTLNNNYIGNENYNVLINAIINADHMAVRGGYGNANVEIFGLKNMIALANQALQNPELNPKNRQQIQSMLSGLNAIQLFGQQRSDAQGRAIHAYDLELTKDGKTLLNGSDLQALMSGGAPQ